MTAGVGYHLEGCCSRWSHLVTSNVDMLTGKQLQDLLQDRLQEVEGPIIPLLSNVSFDRYSSKDTLLELLEHILQAVLAVLWWSELYAETCSCMPGEAQRLEHSAHRTEDILMHAPLHWHLRHVLCTCVRMAEPSHAAEHAFLA